MGGKKINTVYNTLISALQTVVAAETQINVSRSLSNTKSVFVSLDKTFTGDPFKFHNNAGVGQTGYLTHTEERFSHFQLQIGAKLPCTPCENKI